MSKTYLTTQDVATRYGVTTRTVRTLAKQGELPKPLRIGGSYRWLSDELTHFEAERRQ